MRNLVIATIVLAVGSRVATAQAVVPPPSSYQPALSADDRDLLARGEYTDEQRSGGAAIEGFFGFGLGQAFQGRWQSTGWIFTFGETIATVELFRGIMEGVMGCRLPLGQPGYDQTRCDKGANAFVGGMIALGVFRIWGTIDAEVAPRLHNRRVRALRARLGEHTAMPFVAPAGTDGATAGLALRF